MTDEDDIEEIRKRKMEEMQQQAKQGGDEEQRRQSAEQQKQAILRQNLTDGARKRLNTVRMSKQEFAEAVEKQLLALIRSGRLGDQRINEEQMKEILREMKPDDDGFDIRRR